MTRFRGRSCLEDVRQGGQLTMGFVSAASLVPDRCTWLDNDGFQRCIVEVCKGNCGYGSIQTCVSRASQAAETVRFVVEA
jgi:hypothetical protein